MFNKIRIKFWICKKESFCRYPCLRENICNVWNNLNPFPHIYAWIAPITQLISFFTYDKNKLTNWWSMRKQSYNLHSDTMLLCIKTIWYSPYDTIIGSVWCVIAETVANGSLSDMLKTLISFTMTSIRGKSVILPSDTNHSTNYPITDVMFICFFASLWNQTYCENIDKYIHFSGCDLSNKGHCTWTCSQPTPPHTPPPNNKNSSMPSLYPTASLRFLSDVNTYDEMSIW